MRINLIDMFRTWMNVLAKPGEQIFDAERNKPYATLKTALTWILLINAMAILLRLQRSALLDEWIVYGYSSGWHPQSILIEKYAQTMGTIRVFLTYLHLEMATLYGKMWLNSGLFDLVAEPAYVAGYFFLVTIPEWMRTSVKIVLSPAFFLVKVGAYHCVATLLGGRGQFRHYVYFLAAIAVPVSILYRFLDFLPLAAGRVVAVLSDSALMMNQDWYYMLLAPTGNIATVVTVYWLVLFYFATKVEYRLAWWRAVICTVISYPLNSLLSSSLTYAFLGLIEAGKLLRG